MARRRFGRAWRVAARRALLRYARPRPDAPSGVTFLLASAWGMGGTTRTVLNQAGALAARHDVMVISVVRRRERPFFPFPPGVQVSALDDRRGPSGRFARLLRSRPSVLMPAETKPIPAVSLWSDVRLAAALRRRRGVIVGTRPSLNVLAAELAGGEIVGIGQEHLNLGVRDPALVRSVARHYPRLDALVVLTESDARSYAEAVPSPARVEVIPNALSWEPVPEVGDRTPTILAVGRLTPQKGFDLLLEAFATVAPQRPGWRLEICGEGGQHQRLGDLIDAQGLGGAARLLGRVRGIRERMAQASVFVLSSRFEGFPLVLLEAMASGMAIVSFDCPTGPASLITHEENGLLIPPRDTDALARALLRVTADPDLRRRLAEGGLAAAERYRPEVIAEQWHTLLDDLRATR